MYRYKGVFSIDSKQRVDMARIKESMFGKLTRLMRRHECNLSLQVEPVVGDQEPLLRGFTTTQDHSGYLRIRVRPVLRTKVTKAVRLGETHQLTARILFDNDGMMETLGRAFCGAIYVCHSSSDILLEPISKFDHQVALDLLEFVAESMELEDVEFQPFQPQGRIVIPDDDILRMGYELAGTIKMELKRLLNPACRGRLSHALRRGQVKEWGDLGDYCDQNCLGDTESVYSNVNNISDHNWTAVDKGRMTEDEATVQTRCDVVNVAQQEVDKWMRAGGLRI